MSDDEGPFTPDATTNNNDSIVEVDNDVFDFGKDLDLPLIQQDENGKYSFFDLSFFDNCSK